jgi:hypothetical protein
MWIVEPLLLTLEERMELERRLRAQTTTHRVSIPPLGGHLV